MSTGVCDKIRKCTLSSKERLQLGLALLLCLCVYLFGNGFPLGFHYDEPKKVQFILDGHQDYRHPLLMLQIVRLANAFAGFSDEHSVVVLGRTTTAIATMLLVLGMYFLTRRTLAHFAAMTVALTVGLCPTVVVHAHYLKEDMLLVMLMVGTILAYLRFQDRPTLRSTLYLGLATGLLVSSHYKSVLLLVVLGSFEIMNYTRLSSASATSRDEPPTINSLMPRQRVKLSLLAGLVAVFVFAFVNWPMFTELQQFYKGLSYEWRHASRGHGGVVIHALPQAFTYHFRNNILDGMTGPMTWIAVCGVAVAVARYWTLVLQDRILLITCGILYLLPELSPSKPPPDDGRYMIPVIVILAYFAVRAAVNLNSPQSLPLRVAAIATFALAFIWATYDSAMLVLHLNRDTRQQAAAWVQRGLAPTARVVWGPQSAPWHVGQISKFDLTELKHDEVDYVVISSFHYDRFFATEPSKSSEAYRQLFALPTQEFAPRYRSFAFSNPTIRVIRLRH